MDGLWRDGEFVLASTIWGRMATLEARVAELEAAGRGVLRYFESCNPVPIDRALIKANSDEIVALRKALGREK